MEENEEIKNDQNEEIHENSFSNKNILTNEIYNSQNNEEIKNDIQNQNHNLTNTSENQHILTEFNTTANIESKESSGKESGTNLADNCNSNQICEENTKQSDDCNSLKEIIENEIKEPQISTKDKTNPRNQLKRELLSFTPSASSPHSPKQQTIEKIIFEDEKPQIFNEEIEEEDNEKQEISPNTETNVHIENDPIKQEKEENPLQTPNPPPQIQPNKTAQIKKPSLVISKPKKQFYPKPPNSARRPIRDSKTFNSLIGSSPSLPISTRKQTRECTEHIKQLKSKAIKKEKLGKISESDYMDLLFFLELDHRKMIEKRNTKRILKYQNAIEYVRNYYTTMKKNELFEGKIKVLQEQRENLEREIKQFDLKSEIMEVELAKLQEEDRKQKKEKYKEEMQQIEEEWNSQGKMKNYNRPSNILLSMRTQRDNLVQQNRFNDAALLQNSIEEQQKQEVRMSFELFQRDYDEFTRKKKIKFDEEMEMFEDSCILETKKLKKDREKEKSILLVKLRKVEAEESFLMSDKNKICNPGIRRNKSRRTQITSRSLPPLSH